MSAPTLPYPCKVGCRGTRAATGAAPSGCLGADTRWVACRGRPRACPLGPLSNPEAEEERIADERQQRGGEERGVHPADRLNVGQRRAMVEG